MSTALDQVLRRSWPWLSLSLLGVYTLAFFAAPYAGFTWRRSGEITQIYGAGSTSQPLQVGDRLRRVGELSWDAFEADYSKVLFGDAAPGTLVNLVVEREGQLVRVPWTLPGFNWLEFMQRLNSQWFLGYFFWLAGTHLLLAVQPRDERWRALAVFDYLTAGWLVLASGPTVLHLPRALPLQQATFWLSVPAYWHLHWVFPQPLRRLPTWTWPALYALAALPALAQWLGWLPPLFHTAGLALAAGGVLILLALHLVLRPGQRRDIAVLLALVALALAPLILVALVVSAGLNLPTYAGGGALLGLALLPLGYSYAIYRRRLGGLEMRQNRLMALFLFVLLVGVCLVLAGAVAEALPLVPGRTLIALFAVWVPLVVATVYGYPTFQRLVERRLLGLPPAPTHVLEFYSRRITTGLAGDALAHLLRDEILPSLLVRQSALLELNAPGQPMPLYAAGIEEGSLPQGDEIAALLAEAGQYRGPGEAGWRCGWVRLALALRVEGRSVGLWLLGRRDPDDFYAATEIPTLQSLADQVAVALTNIAQARLLHALYQADIDRAETERASLARELHDGALNELGSLGAQLDRLGAPGTATALWRGAVDSLRRALAGLRPAMLAYGLHAALSALAAEMEEQLGPGQAVESDLLASPVRYDPQVEVHVYRIVQQACANAQRHAEARVLRLAGRLEPERIEIEVSDDGVGLGSDGGPDLARLVAERHFGLAGMHERAMLIGARLRITSQPAGGTRVHLVWPADQPPKP